MRAPTLRPVTALRIPAAVLACGALLVGCTTGAGAVDVANGGEFRFVQGTPDGTVIPTDERASAPQFSGTLLDGSAFDSTELAGGPVVINFWGSWCAPCRLETPDFQQVWADVEDEGVAFLGVDVKETDEQFAQAFVDRFGVTFPSVYDPRGEVALAFRDYPANAVPSTIVLDSRGRVAAVYTGAVAQDDLRRVIGRVLAEEAGDG